MFNPDQAAVEEGDSDELRDNPPGPVEAVFIRPVKTLLASQPLAPIEENDDDELIISSIDVSKVEEESKQGDLIISNADLAKNFFSYADGPFARVIAHEKADKVIKDFEEIEEKTSKLDMPKQAAAESAS